MLNAIKKQLKTEWKDWSFMAAFTVGGCLFGSILLFIITKTSGEEETYFQLGTLFGCFITCMYSFIVTAFGMVNGFNLEVSLGCTRKHFFVSFYLINVLANLVAVGMLLAMCQAEAAFSRVCYPTLVNEVELFPYLWKAGPLIAVLLPMAGMFVSALHMRFGRIASWVLWFLWMFGFLAVPKFIDAAGSAPRTYMGMVGNICLQIAHLLSVRQWIGVGVVVSLVCFVSAYSMVKRQQVTC